MEQGYDNRLSVSLDELCFNAENGSTNRRIMNKKHYDDDGNKVFTSKNLETERKRRMKLSARLLKLRSLVPIITNMNKATIIEDAISYIMQLQNEVESLAQELQEMGTTAEEAGQKMYEPSAAEKMKKWGVQEEVVELKKIDENKFWVKMILENERGRFTRLMEALNDLGIEMMDPNVTTMHGAYLITASLQSMFGALDIHQIPNIIKFN